MNTIYAKSNSSGSCKSCGQESNCNCGACGSGDYIQPRFFSGQLLTEDDLQSLANYVSAKNRLHNRHFFGAGVVCGLQVICDPCGGGKVTVESGYALDCCGNDIVLNCDRELDINAMIRDLKTRLLDGQDCGDPCKDAISDESNQDKTRTKGTNSSRHYCLYIRYCEEKTDPVAPYAIGEPCIATNCEPSRIREGVRFELRCQEKEAIPNDFFIQLIACIGDLIDSQDIVQIIFNRGTLTVDDLAKFKEWLLIRLDKYPRMADCDLRHTVKEIIIPEETTNQAELSRYKCELNEALLRYLRDCFCKAIIPPCPPCDDSAVLLACLEVEDCKVVKICNLERTFVLTPVAWRHWNPLLRFFGEVIMEKLICCSPIDLNCNTELNPDPARRQLLQRDEKLFVELLTSLYPSMYKEDAERINNIAQLLLRQFLQDKEGKFSIANRQLGALLEKLSSVMPSETKAEVATLQEKNATLEANLAALQKQNEELMKKLDDLATRVSTIQSAGGEKKGGPKS